MSTPNLFATLDGRLVDDLPAIHSSVHHTSGGTPYLQSPGVVLLARPHMSLGGLRPFLEGFDPGLQFTDYLADPVTLPDSTQLVKAAGQTCYSSFGLKRTRNADAGAYIKRLIESGHQSVLEHAVFSFLFYGVSRSLTHELVRHRFLSVSQLSQRYVSGRVLRFVERPEYQDDPELHALFERRIDRAAAEYEHLARLLAAHQREGAPILGADAQTDLRKKVQQTARSLLPNETETILVATASARAWRWILQLRGSEHAETEIRELAVRALLCLQATDPVLFQGLDIVSYPDGTRGVTA